MYPEEYNRYACFLDGLECYGTRAPSYDEAKELAIKMGYKNDLDFGRAYILGVD